MPEATGVKQDTKFKPGQSGNPAGRPRGARQKLAENFLKELADDFEKHGASAIVEVRETKPDQYLKVIASILPREIEVGENMASALKESRDAATEAFFRAMAEEVNSPGMIQ